MTAPAWTPEMEERALQSLRKRTPGEWRAGKVSDSVVTTDVTYRVDDSHRSYYGGECVAESMVPADRDFVIAAGPLLEAALAEIDRLREAESRAVELERQVKKLETEISDYALTRVTGRLGPTNAEIDAADNAAGRRRARRRK